MPDPDKIPLIGAYWRAVNHIDRHNVPILGETTHALNAVIDFVEYGCFPNWTVWVTTLRPAAGHMVLQFLDFGLNDILRGYFRPTGIRGVGAIGRVPVRSRRRPKTKAGRLWRRAEIPELGNEIGKALPGSELFRARKVTGAETYLWTIDAGLQRFMWWWLVADVTDDFITEWTTGIMESEDCRRGRRGEIVATNATTANHFPETWSALGAWTVTKEEPPGCFNHITGSITPPIGTKMRASLSGDAVANDGSPITNARLAINTGGLPPTNGLITPYPVTPPDSPSDISLVGEVNPALNATVIGWAENPGFIRWKNLKLHVGFYDVI